MPFVIEITDRDFDVENVTNALRIPAEREYVGEITVDDPQTAQTVFHGDVCLRRLEGDVLIVAEWHESERDDSLIGREMRFDVADIRRISFY